MRSDKTPPTTIEGTLEHVVFTNAGSGWSVVKIRAESEEIITCVGHFPGVQPGEHLRLSGRWAHDPKFGNQFKVESYTSVQPSTLVGIERYLGSGLVDGIGKEMARRLVEHFGLETLEVIDDSPERLTEVPGIGPKRAAQIRAAWQDQRSIRDVMVFLQGHGVAASHAQRIFKHYGPEAVDIVRADPYRLATDIFGIGFKTADRVAAELGIAPDAPRRAEAGTLHVLGVFAEEGHVYAPYRALEEQATEMLGVEPALVRTAVETLARQADVIVDRDATGTAPGQIDGDTPIYLKRLFVAENQLAARLRDIVGAEALRVPTDLGHALEWFETKHRLSLAAAQRRAVVAAVDNKLLLLTGGPGTGKTTIIRAALEIFQKKSLRVVLCAPTGRAAKRMAEATGTPAKTIHRVLEFSPREMRFQRDAQFPIEADAVIVDEFSMVDVLLARSLVAAMPDAARLIVVGDADQLPSVGPGNVLRDLLESGVLPSVCLTEIFRQAESSLIVHNAHRVNRGDMPRFGEAASGADCFIVERDDPERALETVRHLVTQRIPQSFGLDPVDDIQVLAPMRRGTLGTLRLNAELQAALTPPGPALNRGAASFRVGDKVMQTRNNYDLETYNGDIGRVLAIERGEALVVRFDERDVRYSLAEVDQLTLAFACSIHKSQGSEYRACVIVLHTQHYLLLKRNLLYTALTRGRELVVLVGTKRAIGMAVRDRGEIRRYTRLGERLAAKVSRSEPAPDTYGSME